MENNVNFSFMKVSDLDEVVEIENKSFANPWTRDNFKEAIEKDYCLFLTARMKNGELAGYCGLYQSDKEADITNIAVNEKFRNLGVGMQMLTQLIKIGESRNILDFTLEVRRSNIVAIRLYEKCGFESVGFRKNFYRNPIEDACIMWRYH